MEVGGASPAPETWSKSPAGPSPSGRAAHRVKQVLGEAIEAVVDGLTNPF